MAAQDLPRANGESLPRVEEIDSPGSITELKPQIGATSQPKRNSAPCLRWR